jgi:hypothetical protein
MDIAASGQNFSKSIIHKLEFFLNIKFFTAIFAVTSAPGAGYQAALWYDWGCRGGAAGVREMVTSVDIPPCLRRGYFRWLPGWHTSTLRPAGRLDYNRISLWSEPRNNQS